MPHHFLKQVPEYDRVKDAQERYCDLLIIGAGPAGCAAAIEAARGGLKVILADRRQKIGTPAQCAGYLPVLATQGYEESAGAIINRISGMLTFTPDGIVHETSAPGFIVNREIFDQSLSNFAVRTGVELMTATRAVSRQGCLTTVRTDTGNLFIRSTLIIGADGPRSIAGSWIGSINRKFVVGAQWTVTLRQKLEHTRVYFDERLTGGYGWLFPSGDNANAGVGIDSAVGVKPIEALKWFVGKLAEDGLIRKKPLMRTGGLISVGGILNVSRDQVILAGDAAGLCHPVSGAGIANALQSGKMAGSAAVEFIAKRNLQALKLYAEEIEATFGDSFRNAVAHRRLMYLNEPRTRKEFSLAVSSGWISRTPASN